MGALDHLSNLLDCSTGSSKLEEKKRLQTVEVKVRIDCERCERKMKKALEGMKGVTQVEVERKANKVTVVGYVNPSKVVARVAYRTGKKAELCPYFPYGVLAHLMLLASTTKKPLLVTSETPTTLVCLSSLVLALLRSGTLLLSVTRTHKSVPLCDSIIVSLAIAKRCCL